jgi:hypothetical protein
MSARVTSGKDAAQWVLVTVITVVVGGFALYAALNGSAWREKAQKLRLEEVAREDRVLCEKLGIHYGSERFSTCVAVLSEARRREAQRLASDAAGIL